MPRRRFANIFGALPDALLSGFVECSGLVAVQKRMGLRHIGNVASSADDGVYQAQPGSAPIPVAPSGLFIKNPDANGQYLLETRSQFANLNDWTSSDYLFKQLGVDPDATHKRLGDGFYEQRMVREQMNELTGRAPANGASDDSVYQSLLVNAVSFAQAYDLRPGIALTAEQVSHLTSDIVWMESQQVRLPDGSIDTVLVPKVYLAHLGDGAVTAGGALVTGGGAGVSINVHGDIINRGGVIDGGSGRTLLVSGNDILNQGGTIAGGDVLLAAARDVRNESLASTLAYSSVNTSGSYTALSNQASIVAVGGDGVLLAGRSLTVASVMDQVKTDQHGDASAKNFEKLAADNQTVVGSSVSAGGALQLAAGIRETAALTVSSSALAAGGALALGATGDVNIGGVQEVHVRDDASHHEASSMFTKSSSASVDYVASSTLVGSSLNAGSVSVKAGSDVVVTGSALTAQDALTVIAGRDLVVTSGQQTVDESHSAESKKSGFSLSPASGIGYSKAEQNQNGTASSTTQLGSTLSGGTVTAVAGRDLSIVASNVVADGAVVLAAMRDVNIVSAENTTARTSDSSSKKSGSIGSAWQPSVGTVKTTEQGTSSSVTQAGSQVASLGGSVTVQAGETYRQTASNVLVPRGDNTIVAKDVQIVAGYDTSASDSRNSYSKTAIGGSVSLPVVSTVQGIQSLASAAKNAGSDRMTALAAVTAGMQVADAYKGVTAAGDPTGIKIGVTLGTSKSESDVVQSSSTAVGSQVKAGGDVMIVATGGGAGSNITSIGSDISGGGNVTLIADNQVNLLAAANTSSQHSTNSSSGASIGVNYNIGASQNGFSLELAATGGRSGPSAGTAFAVPSMICLPPLCVTKLIPVAIGSPNYVPLNALLSGGKGNGNQSADAGSSASGETDKVGSRDGNAGAVSGAVVTSDGTASAATSQQLKGQLAAQNLSNIAAQDSRLAAVVNGSGKLNPNFSIGTATNYEADQLGKIWVGDGAVRMNDGSGMISADGTRAYRFPVEKNSPLSTTGIQANFETYNVNSVTG